MKLLHSRGGVKVLFYLFLTVFMCPNLYAHDNGEESLESIDSSQNSDMTSDKLHVEGHKKRRAKLTPTYLKSQFAGSMGLMSFGGGWDYGRRNQWETDLLIGFVPKFSTNQFKGTLTLKQNYMPWSTPLGKGGFSMEPLACGLYMTTISGSDFWSRQPTRYPSKYYKFSTKIHLNVFIGQRFTYTRTNPSARKFTKSVTLFYEISTSDFYIISAVQNSYLKASDIFGLSFGLKLQIF